MIKLPICQWRPAPFPRPEKPIVKPYPGQDTTIPGPCEEEQSTEEKKEL